MMRPPPPKYPLLLSIAAALFTAALKASAYLVTGSVGLLSDAVESLVNLAAALVALFSLWYAAQPVDDSHTYGHEKIEYFSCGLEGILILLASAGIVWFALVRLAFPEPLRELGLGLSLELIASVANLVVGLLLLRVGRETESIVLEADGHHLLTDVWCSVGVMAGLGVVWLTELPMLDTVIAMVFGAALAITAIKLIHRSFNGLMDHALPTEEQAIVRNAIASKLEPGTTFHALRTRQSGAHRFADFHLLVPGRLTVQEAHNWTERIEAAVCAALPGIEVTVHIEPIEEKAAWQDSPLLPIEQARHGK